MFIALIPNHEMVTDLIGKFQSYDDHSKEGLKEKVPLGI